MTDLKIVLEWMKKKGWIRWYSDGYCDSVTENYFLAIAGFDDCELQLNLQSKQDIMFLTYILTGILTKKVEEKLKNKYGYKIVVSYYTHMDSCLAGVRYGVMVKSIYTDSLPDDDKPIILSSKCMNRLDAVYKAYGGHDEY